MKKTGWILIFCLVHLANLHAQSYRLYVGVNRMNVSKSLPGISFSAKGGYQLGADVQIGKRHLYFQPGVQYSVAHLGLTHPFFTDSKSDLWVSGVKIPVLLGWRQKFAPAKNIRFFAGPSFMAVTNVKQRNNSDPAFLFTDKNYHDVEWAAHLGVGIDWGHFFIDLGFQKGLTYVFTGGSEARSNTFYLNVGAKF